MDVHHASVGGVAIRCTHLEYHVQRILWRLTGLQSNVGRCITHHMSFQALVDAILSIASETPQYQAAVSELKQLLDECKTLRDRRNEVVHAQWATILREVGDQGAPLRADEMEGVVIKARGALKTRVIRMSFDNIAQIGEDMGSFTTKLSNFVEANLPERRSFE